jgi:hypothetical protein
VVTDPPLPLHCSQISESTEALQTQLLQIRYSSEVANENFIAQIERQNEETVFVGITSLNTRWFVIRKKRLSYLVEKAPFPPIPFDPLELICNIELLWKVCNDSTWHDDPHMDHLTFSCSKHTGLKGEMTLFDNRNRYKLTIKFKEKKY